ncbi:type II toxin-antitoxin system ParD family antitoxin [Patescibacteria group bacterium]
MTTINISLPTKLKTQAESLVKAGFYVSFSDLVRDSLRHLVARNKYDLWAQKAKKELKKGQAKVLKSTQEVDQYFDKL